jgi:hypothetical protein
MTAMPVITVYQKRGKVLKYDILMSYYAEYTGFIPDRAR